jgi:hypothetical protein
MKRWTLLVLPALFACTESVESTDVRTSGVYPEFQVVADGSGNTNASARLKVGGNDSNTFLELQGSDVLEVSAKGQTQRMTSSGDHGYGARFAFDEAGTEFVFSFHRGEEDSGAVRSAVTLPEPFALQMGTTAASRASDAVSFTWDPPAGGDVHWDVDGDCVWTDQGSTPDDGSHTLNLSDVRAFGEETESCSVRLTVQRSHTGSIDSAFSEGGENRAYQLRVQTFTSTP